MVAVSSRPTSASLVIEHSAANPGELAKSAAKFFTLVDKDKDQKAEDQSKPSPKERAALRVTTVGFAGMAAY